MLALTGVALPAMVQAQGLAGEPVPPVNDMQAQNRNIEPVDIVVTGSRASREQAVERKRELPTVSDVVASDDIGKLPDFNTAEAVQRLPGISVETDQGEPRYVVVRGIDSNFNQVTIDGNLVGVPEAEGRRVALDAIPSDLVSAIYVVKAVTPDYDGNAIGGSINVVTPTAFDRPNAFTFGTVRGNYNEMANKAGFGGSITHGERFGADRQFGIVVAASYLKRHMESDLVEFINWKEINPDINAPATHQLFDYSIMRERLGAIANLDWRPNDEVRIYLRNIYSEFTDKEDRDLFELAFASGTPSFPTPTSISFPNGRGLREFRKFDQTQKLYNISPGAELRFDGAELDLNYTFAHAQERTPRRDDLQFRSATGYETELELQPGLVHFNSIPDAMFDPAAFPLRRILRRHERIDEDLHAVRADLKVPFGNEGSFFKVGGKFISRDKVHDNTREHWNAVDPSTFAETGGALPPPKDFYHGAYEFGPTIDYSGILDYYVNQHPELITLDELTTAIQERSADYRIREEIFAGYGMASMTLGNLTAIGGVRVERTEGRYHAFSIRDGGASIAPLSFNQSYTHVLPSVHLNYRPSEKFTLRAAWTNTIGRPNYNDSVPAFTEESGEGSAGNPDLKPYTSIGLDLSAEYYPASDTIYSIGIFYKYIKNPVFTQRTFDTSFAGVPLLSLSQPQNATDGKLLGVEMNLQQRFTFLPAPFDGFGASVNGTYVDSSVNVPTRPGEDLPFFRQSKKILNASLFYERGPFEARVAVSYRDAYLSSIGATPVADIYYAPRTVIAARMSYQINDAIEVFGSISNLNDAPSTRYQGLPSQIYAREIYSFNGDFGVSFRF